MTTGDAARDRTGEIALQIRKLRAGDVPLGKVTRALVRIIQGKAAVENQQVRVSQALLQLGGADQLGNGHAGHPVGKGQ